MKEILEEWNYYNKNILSKENIKDLYKCIEENLDWEATMNDFWDWNYEKIEKKEHNKIIEKNKYNYDIKIKDLEEEIKTLRSEIKRLTR